MRPHYESTSINYLMIVDMEAAVGKQNGKRRIGTWNTFAAPTTAPLKASEPAALASSAVLWP